MNNERHGNPSREPLKTVQNRPDNFLPKGILFVGVGLATMGPLIYQFEDRDVVSFQVVDSFDGDVARGDWGGPWGGVVRPLLEWTTQFRPNEDRAPVTLPNELES